MSAPVGQASRQPALVQCLQTSDMNTHEPSSGESTVACPVAAASTRLKSPLPGDGAGASGRVAGMSGRWPGVSVSTKRTCRHVAAPSEPVWS
jgi:hypothetical protein